MNNDVEIIERMDKLAQRMTAIAKAIDMWNNSKEKCPFVAQWLKEEREKALAEAYAYEN